MKKDFLTLIIFGILIIARAEAEELKVGFAQLSITPDLLSLIHI